MPAPARTAIPVAAVLLLFAPACLGGSATPTSPPDDAATSPSPSPSPPGRSPTPTAGATAAAPTTPAGAPSPTDRERARFVADHTPADASDLRDVAADVDGDPDAEIVFAYVDDAARRVRVDVADWVGARYAVSASVTGGPADDLTGVRVGDVNSDGRTDVATFQTVAAAGMSLSLWSGTSGGRLEPLAGVGGCFDGSNTYGDAGAELRDSDGDGRAEIHARCEQADVPQPLWPVEVYTWQDGAYRCDHRENVDGGRVPCGERG